MRVRSRFVIATVCGYATSAYAQGLEPSLPAVSVAAERPAEGYAPAASLTAAKSTGIALRDIPQAVNVVPPELLQDQTITSLQEALRNVPGISQDAGDGQRDQFVIRGFSAVNDMYLDGMRDDSYYFRDLSNIDRIEVLKGPSSVLYGRGSSGGLINRITKRPTKEAVRQLSVQASSAGQRRSEFDLGSSTTDDSLRVRITGALENSDGFRDHYFLKRQAIAPSVQLNLSSQTSLLIQADYLKDSRLADTGIPAVGSHPAEVPRGTYYGSVDAQGQNNVTSEVAGSTITLEHAFGKCYAF